MLGSSLSGIERVVRVGRGGASVRCGAGAQLCAGPAPHAVYLTFLTGMMATALMATAMIDMMNSEL